MNSVCPKRADTMWTVATVVEVDFSGLYIFGSGSMSHSFLNGSRVTSCPIIYSYTYQIYPIGRTHVEISLTDKTQVPYKGWWSSKVTLLMEGPLYPGIRHHWMTARHPRNNTNCVCQTLHICIQPLQLCITIVYKLPQVMATSQYFDPHSLEVFFSLQYIPLRDNS